MVPFNFLPSRRRPCCASVLLHLLMRVWHSFIYILAANASSVDALAIDSPGLSERLSVLDITGPTKAAGIAISTYISRARAFMSLINVVRLDPNNLQGMTTFS